MTSQRTDPDGLGTTTILLTAASLALLTIGIFSTAWWIGGRPTSEWPAWIEAGATVAAVGAAIVAGFYAARAFGLQFAREQRWEEQQQSAQASLVDAWPTRPRTRTQDGENRIHAVEGLVRNASELPVCDVRIIFYVTWRDGFSGEHMGTEVLGDTELPFLVPSHEAQPVGYFALDRLGNGKTLPAPQDMTIELNAQTLFRDSAGVGWFRNLDGRLATIAERDVPPH